MNFRHLKIFLTVCEIGNVTKAAKELYLAQPTVSQVISDLEKYYDVRLFERLNHRLYLTAAGERLRSYAQHILNLSDQAQQELSDLEHGSLRVGASLTIGAYLLPGLMTAFIQQAPEVEVFTLVDNTSVIERMILEDQLDFGLVEGPVASPYIVEEYYAEDQLVLIGSPEHELVRHPGILKVQDLSNQSFITREAGSGTQRIFEAAMLESGVRWKTVGVYNNIEAIKRAVIANLALGVVARIAIDDEIAQGKLVALPVEGISLRRKFNLIYHRQKFSTKAMRAFWDLCRSKVEQEDQPSRTTARRSSTIEAAI